MKKFYTIATMLLMCSHFAFSSEFTLRVKKQEQVVVTVQSQTQTNNTNYFQFFQIPSGQLYVNVTDKWTGQTLFSNYVTIPANYQVYAELDYAGNMSVLSSTPIYNNGNVGTVTYGNTGNNANWNNNYGNHCGTAGTNNYPYYNNFNQVSYAQFLTSLKNESFDSYRLKDSKRYAAKTQLSAQQISEIAATFTFDSYRLDFAKAAYANCYDKANYFLLKNTFTFTSYYNDLIESVN